MSRWPSYCPNTGLERTQTPTQNAAMHLHDTAKFQSLTSSHGFSALQALPECSPAPSRVHQGAYTWPLFPQSSVVRRNLQAQVGSNMTQHIGWSQINPTLYSICFAGQARTLQRCSACFSARHSADQCPQAPFQPMIHATQAASPSRDIHPYSCRSPANSASWSYACSSTVGMAHTAHTVTTVMPTSASSVKLLTPSHDLAPEETHLNAVQYPGLQPAPWS